MWQLDILTTDNEYPEIETILETQQALSFSMLNAGDDIIIEHELNEKPAWSFIKIEALFASQELTDSAKKTLEAANLGQNIKSYEIANKNWIIYGLKDFQAIAIAENLWIYPPWLVPPNAKEPFIVIDPGFAFGTGQHATTKMCLEWLSQHDLKGKTIIDYGCGSGILALAALKLGAKKVYGIDIDPQACDASRQNASLNHILEHQFIIGEHPEILPNDSDILIANIVMNPLLAFRDFFHEKVKSDGYLVLSGLLNAQLDPVIDHYQHCFQLQATHTELDWGCLVFKPIPL